MVSDAGRRAVNYRGNAASELLSKASCLLNQGVLAPSIALVTGE